MSLSPELVYALVTQHQAEILSEARQQWLLREVGILDGSFFTRMRKFGERVVAPATLAGLNSLANLDVKKGNGGGSLLGFCLTTTPGMMVTGMFTGAAVYMTIRGVGDWYDRHGAYLRAHDHDPIIGAAEHRRMMGFAIGGSVIGGLFSVCQILEK